MDAIDLYRCQLAHNHWAWSEMLADLNDDSFNWKPPGKANSIGATLLHVLGMEDTYIQGALLGQMTLWESQSWPEKLGLATLPNQGNAWVEARSRRLELASVLAYAQEVHTATQQALETLTPQDLERELMLGPRIRQVADLLATLLIHNASHGGEIAALKGLQGMKGQAV
jgi:hypothetical protein